VGVGLRAWGAFGRSFDHGRTSSKISNFKVLVICCSLLLVSHAPPSYHYSDCDPLIVISAMIQAQPKLRKQGGNNRGLRITGFQKWVKGLTAAVLLLMLMYAIRMITITPDNVQKKDLSKSIFTKGLKPHQKTTPKMLEKMEKLKMSKTHLDLSQTQQDIKERVEESQRKISEKIRRARSSFELNPLLRGINPKMGEAEESPQVRGG
jgi:hypothetical protein